MPEGANVPAVSMANTKKEMLTAYQEMKALLARREQAVADAERERDRYKKEAAQAAAERAAADDPVRRLHDMKATIGRELASMAEQYEQAVDEYTKLKQAVADKTDELERIYGVESAAQDLTALLEAHAARKSAFEAEIAAARAQWEAERTSRADAVAAERARLELDREREQEAYDYALARERERRSNELRDELAVLERQIAEKRAAAEREIAETQVAAEREVAALRAQADAEVEARSAELAGREKSVAERERHADDLQAKVDGFQAQLAAEVDRAVKEATSRLRATHEAELALARKEHEGERNVLASRIESLQQMLEQQTAQITTLTTQQERAYGQIQEIASKAVEGAQRSVAAPVSQPRTARPFDEAP